MPNLVNTNSAVSVRDAQKNGKVIALAENEVKNLKAGNQYEINGKMLFISSSFNPKNRIGSKTTYNGTYNGTYSAYPNAGTTRSTTTTTNGRTGTAAGTGSYTGTTSGTGMTGGR